MKSFLMKLHSEFVVIIYRLRSMTPFYVRLFLSSLTLLFHKRLKSEEKTK